jgi:prepilin-type processing-associated H-X9-DG protein
VGRFTPGAETVYVYHGPNNGNPLDCKLSRIYKPAETLLFADCGVRPEVPGAIVPLDYSDSLYYTTNYVQNGSGAQTWEYPFLSATLDCSWLVGRVPFDRHGGPLKVTKNNGYNTFGGSGRINIAFADGHADSVLVGNFTKVRVSPYP